MNTQQQTDLSTAKAWWNALTELPGQKQNDLVVKHYNKNGEMMLLDTLRVTDEQIEYIWRQEVIDNPYKDIRAKAVAWWESLKWTEAIPLSTSYFNEEHPGRLDSDQVIYIWNAVGEPKANANHKP